MSSRLPTWVALIGALFTLQLAWWGVLLWRNGADTYRRELQLLNLQRDLAEIAWREQLAVDSTTYEGDTWQELSTSFPSIVYLPGSDGDEIQVSSDAMSGLNADLSSTHLMIFGEGTFFLIITSLALSLLLRTANRESNLALQQTNFVHAVTHEFRSPLQSLRLAVETLQRRPDPELTRSYGEGMLDDLQRLDDLVEKLLDTGRLDSGVFEVQLRSIDLGREVKAACDQWQARATSQTAQLELDLDPDVFADADPTAIPPILHNLLDNALKYGAGRAIQLSVRREQAYAVLVVKDQGCGFQAADRGRLFERFWRAGEERVRTSPGVGLGLYIVAQLARAQGASVDARSDGAGQGAEFSVRWPASSNMRPMERVAS